MPEDGDAGDAVNVVVAVEGDFLFLGEPCLILCAAVFTPGSSSGLMRSVNLGLRNAEPDCASVTPRFMRSCAKRVETLSDFASGSARGRAE